MAIDVAASVLESARDASFFTNFAGGVGIEISAGDFDLKRRDITKVDGEINPRIGPASRTADSVTTAPGTTHAHERV